MLDSSSIYDSFAKLCTVNVKQQQDELFQQMTRFLDGYHLLDEYMTVSMIAPRRSGKTTALGKFVRRHMPNSVIIVINQSMVRIFKEEHNLKAITVNQLNNLRGMELDGLFIDEYMSLSDEDFNKIKTFAKVFADSAIMKKKIFLFGMIGTYKGKVDNSLKFDPIHQKLVRI
jgi:predicted AAA+ superfamily ATPase